MLICKGFKLKIRLKFEWEHLHNTQTKNLLFNLSLILKKPPILQKEKVLFQTSNNKKIAKY